MYNHSQTILNVIHRRYCFQLLNVPSITNFSHCGIKSPKVQMPEGVGIGGEGGEGC